ncbi:MAG TPA: HAD family hydrolase [Nevskiaceae bacterium]|nr:HAD family hydrolase [Nevskiaceae bacterium]
MFAMTAMNCASAATPPPDATVSVSRLPTLLSRYPRARVLSLDCFDTVLWRQVMRPADVFCQLAQSPLWKRLQLEPGLRVAAERDARRRAKVLHGNTEVTLQAIYGAALERSPCASPDSTVVDSLAQLELAAEMQICYALPQAVALLRDAAARGVRVVVVSDMYLRESQLRKLLEATLPPDAYAAIERVFVSCEHAKGKAGGLFAEVLAALGVRACDVLHVGDSPTADWQAAKAAGLESLLLIRLAEGLVAQTRYQVAALQLFEPAAGQTRPVTAGYTPVLAGLDTDPADTARQIARATLGPMMHAFASWVVDLKRQCEQRGERVKLAFLMRDGYLPYQACCAIVGPSVGQPVYISRIAALLASCRSADDIRSRLASVGSLEKSELILKQFPLTLEDYNGILEAVGRARDPVKGVAEQLLRPDRVKRIVARSSSLAEHLLAHLRTALALQAGDTLVFVDLGYNATAQRALEPVARLEWRVDLQGWYFMRMPMLTADERCLGLIDTRHFDARSIRTMSNYVALLETLCTCGGGSVVDYDAAGTPILASDKTLPEQAATVGEIQKHAIEFVREAEAYYQQGGRRLDEAAMADASFAEFAQMVFFPTRDELAHYGKFRLELNRGTDITVPLVDPDRALLDLRSRGLAYADPRSASQRINTPHELRYAGLEQSLAVIDAHRFGFPMCRNEWSLRSEAVTLLLIQGQQSVPLPAAAQPTYDGYYRLTTSIGMGQFGIALLLGRYYKWLQLLSCEVRSLADVRERSAAMDGTDVRAGLVTDGLVDHGHGLLECTKATAAVLLPAGSVGDGRTRLALEIVFRPLVPAVS